MPSLLGPVGEKEEGESMTDTSKLRATQESDAVAELKRLIAVAIEHFYTRIENESAQGEAGKRRFLECREKRIALERQRDELVEALRRALNPSSSTSLKFAQETLAKIEGERK